MCVLQCVVAVSMMWSTSPLLLLLLSFSSLCVFSGVLLLDGGWAVSSWLSSAAFSPSSSFTPASPPSSSSAHSLSLSPRALSVASSASHSSPSFSSFESPLHLSHLPYTRPSSALHPPSPSALLADYHAAAAVAAASLGWIAAASSSSSSPSPSACSPSLSFSSPPPSSAVAAAGGQPQHHLLPTPDDPSLNPSLSGHTGHALLQLLVGLSLSLSLRLSFVQPPSMFPSRPHWDTFTGLGAGERRETDLQLSFDQLQPVTVRERSRAQAEEELRELLSSARPATLVRLETPRVQLTDGDTDGWLAAAPLLSAVAVKYCHARVYRPVAVDLYAQQRLSRSPPLLIAVHVQCDDAATCSSGVDSSASRVLHLQRLLTSKLGVDSGDLSFHLFADQSALPQASNAASEESARMLAAAVTAAQLSVHLHLHTPSMWAMHHYITADVFIGDLHASHPSLPQHSPRPRPSPFECAAHLPASLPSVCALAIRPSLLAAVIRSPAVSFLPSTLHLPGVLPHSSLSPPSGHNASDAAVVNLLSTSLTQPRPLYRALTDCAYAKHSQHTGNSSSSSTWQ